MKRILFVFYAQLAAGICAIGPVSAQDEVYKSSAAIEKELADAGMSLYFASWYYSFIGEYRKSLEVYDQAGKASDKVGRSCGIHTPVDAYQPAADYIISRSGQEQIVIVNEAHHQPLHRVFTASLLEGLYEKGFRYLGLETLAEDSLVNIRKWLLPEDGFYTREPQFGNMVRKALQIGFFVFGYEAEGNGSVREKGQARNIMKILARDPSAKILVHCGFSHVIEGGIPGWGRAMAGELKALSGIDPLTIDQVELTERSLRDYESPCYGTVSSRIKDASIAFDAGGNPVPLSADTLFTDLRVIHARTRFISGRPHWLLRDGAWRHFDLSGLELGAAFPYIVTAYIPEEKTEGIPVDQIEVSSPGEKALVLPKGVFVLQIKDRNGESRIREIVVD